MTPGPPNVNTRETYSYSLELSHDVCLKVRKNQTRIGVVSYSTMVRADFYLGEFFNVSDILPLVWAIDYMAGVTNTADGINEMRDMFSL